MHKYLITIFRILIIMFIVILIVLLTKYITSLIIGTSNYISKSKINGYGLFANKDYKKGDIIIEELFPNNTSHQVIDEYIPWYLLDKFFAYEGKYLNHCSKNYNSDAITKDNIHFSLIATKDIHCNEEITSNYDLLHHKMKFIGSSKDGYKEC